MIKSMTGFGRFETVTQDYKITVEMKSVNHRYCDLNLKLPKKFNAYENDLRNIVKEYVARGKVDVYISFEDYTDRKSNVTYHSGVAKGYVDAIRAASEEFGIEPMLSASALIRFPDVISLEEGQLDLDGIYPAVETTVRGAGEQFLNARTKEGENLRADLLQKLQFVLELVEQVEKRSPEIIKEYRQKITDKVAELLGDTKLDENVLATEITIFADKVCVDEETVRLKSHVEAMQETLELEESIGRKLDFIAQEMNREANTILSKANDRELSACAIDLKTEIEKIREQIQNIE